MKCPKCRTSLFFVGKSWVKPHRYEFWRCPNCKRTFKHDLSNHALIDLGGD